MFSVIVSDRKSDMENRQAIRPEQRKLFPSDYFSRNFSLMIISLNCRIFTPGVVKSAELSKNNFLLHTRGHRSSKMQSQLVFSIIVAAFFSQLRGSLMSNFKSPATVGPNKKIRSKFYSLSNHLLLKIVLKPNFGLDI